MQINRMVWLIRERTKLMNELRFEGRIDRITIKNKKVIKFTLINTKNKRITGTVFNSQITRHIYERLEELLGQTVTITGEVYETSYQDKKTNQWINGYCVCVYKLEEEEELAF